MGLSIRSFAVVPLRLLQGAFVHPVTGWITNPTMIRLALHPPQGDSAVAVDLTTLTLEGRTDRSIPGNWRARR